MKTSLSEHNPDSPAVLFLPILAFVPWYLPGLASRAPMYTKIHRCSSPLLALFIHGFHTQGFNQPQMAISVRSWLNPQIQNLWNTEGKLYYLLKKLNV